MIAACARSFAPTLDPTYGYATVMGSALTPVFGLIQRTTAPAESVDSLARDLRARGALAAVVGEVREGRGMAVG